MIKVSHLTKKYDTITAVDDISFEVTAGETAGFVGVNGAGKSTTLKMLSGYLSPCMGDIYFYDRRFGEHDYDIRRDIGYLPEKNPLYDNLIVYDFLAYIAQLKEIPKKRIKEKIMYVALRCGLTDRLTQRIGTLSKGYRQRVGLAQAILNDPKLLILDEPTVGLDPNQIVEIRELISELGEQRTLILSSHILSEIQAICDKIMIIHQGRLILDAKMDSITQDGQSLSDVFASLTTECCHPSVEGN